jgi:lysophospholipase
MSVSAPQTTWLTAADGVKLFVRRYVPQSRFQNRALLWCHGVGEHGGRYDHVVAEFLARGWQVILPDLRGHGRSEGLRTDVASFDVYLDDFDLVAREYALEPDRTALFGHSMGALVMIRFAQTRPRGWGALALSAPLLGVAVPIPWWKWQVGRLLARLAPRTHLKTGIREDNLTADPAFLAARRADPMIQRTVTVRWFFAMLAALQAAYSDAPKLTLPILILQGLADRTTDPQAPAAWLRTTRSVDPRLIEFPEGLHEILNDREWRTGHAALADWLDQHVRPTAL